MATPPRPPLVVPNRRDYTRGMGRGRLASIAAALSIAAVAAVSAGCGGSALALDPVAAAATKTQHAGAARIRFALQLSSPKLQGGKVVQLQGSGAIDGTSGELNIDLGSLLQNSGTPAGTDSTMQEVFLRQNGDYVTYVRLGLLASRLPAGKQWIELDLSKLGQAAGLDLGQLMSGSQVSPGDLLSILESEGAKIRNLGAETVDGAATTHYRVTLDLAKALQAKGLTSPLLQGLAANMPAVPADVWIGADGLVRRVRVSLGLAQNRVGMTMDISDYGADVTIAPPPSSEVLDLTQLVQQQGTSSTVHW